MNNNILYIDDLLEAVDEKNSKIILEFINKNFDKLGYENIVLFSHVKIDSEYARLVLFDKTVSGDIPTDGELFTHRAAFRAISDSKNKKYKSPWWHVLNITYRIFSRDIYKMSKIISAKKKPVIDNEDFIGTILYKQTSKFLHPNILYMKDFKIFNESFNFIMEKLSKSINTVEFCNLMVKIIENLPEDIGFHFSKKYISNFWEAAAKRIELERDGKYPSATGSRLDKIIHELDGWAWISAFEDDYNHEKNIRKNASIAKRMSRQKF